MSQTSAIFGRKYSLIIGSPRKVNLSNLNVDTSANATVVRKKKNEFAKVQQASSAILNVVQEEDFIEIKDLQIKATLPLIKSQKGTSQKQATIDIYNLSEDSQLRLKEENLVFISGGYEQDEDLPSLYTGQISTVSTERKGADVITTITLGDNVTARRDIRISKAWKAGTTYDVILTDLLSLAKANGVALGRRLIPEGTGIALNTRATPTGITVTGNLFAAITQIGSAVGVRNYFSDGKFYVEPVEAPQLVTKVILNPSNIKEDVRQNSSLKGDKTSNDGIRLKVFLDGRIKVSGLLQIETGKHKGTYEVTNVTHYLDFEGSWWETEVLAKRSVG